MFSSHAKPIAVIPAYTRQSVSEFSSARRTPVIISSRNRPLAASSISGGAPTAMVNGLDSEPPVLTAASNTISRPTDTTTATEAPPHTKANTSSRGGSGSQRSSQR